VRAISECQLVLCLAPWPGPGPPKLARYHVGAPVSHAWFVVRWLHLLAMAFFVGGQMMLAAVVVPIGRRFTDRESLRLIETNADELAAALATA
jgi:hypothetical protein